jgi:hypothetical protein
MRTTAGRSDLISPKPVAALPPSQSQFSPLPGHNSPWNRLVNTIPSEHVATFPSPTRAASAAMHP